MEIRIELNGKKRKDLVTAVGEFMGATPVYQQAPSYAYDIGGIILNRENTLLLSADTQPETIRQLLDTLQAKGFSAEESQEELELQEEPQAESQKEPKKQDSLSIQIPRKGFDPESLENLQKIIDSKTALIKKALGVADLPIVQTDDAISFPWFHADTPPEDMAAYTQFISALCDMAKKQKRVLATERNVENEKYAFRCFLLRLGFIGEEYADTRRILLRNLTGNGSFRNGRPKTAKTTKPVEPIEPKVSDEQPASPAPDPSPIGGKLKTFLNGITQSIRAIF